jgi:5-methylcytosine-specific restriction endonuclease McrA
VLSRGFDAGCLSWLLYSSDRFSRWRRAYLPAECGVPPGVSYPTSGQERAMSPSRAPSICTHPACGAIAVKAGRCGAHPLEKRKAHDPAQRRFYSSARWTQLSKQVRNEEPVCRICRRTPSTNVDHIDGDYNNNARENLRALCTPCNRNRTGVQHHGKRQSGGGVTKK